MATASYKSGEHSVVTTATKKKRQSSEVYAQSGNASQRQLHPDGKV